MTRILVVDDDNDLRRAMVRWLANAGYDVVDAETIAQARAAIAMSAPEILIADLVLPDGDGADLVREWKSRDPRLPALVVAGDAIDDAERVRVLEAGADDVMAKPVLMLELSRRVEVHDRILRAFQELRRALAEGDNLRLHSSEAAALLAHDLSNGLTVAMSSLILLDDHVPDDPAGEAKALLAGARHQMMRMGSLVRNFVDIARSEDGALKAARAPCDLVALARSSAAVHRPALGKGTIEIDVPPAVTVAADPVLVERVLHNLLGNAVRYAGGGRVRLRIPPPESERVVVQVSNTGATIPIAQRTRLFEKYQKGQETRAQTGMGLYFCRLACEAHGGSIDLVDGVEGFPTTFEIRLPA